MATFFLQVIVTIIGISFLSEFLLYRIKKSSDEDNSSYVPENFIRPFCYFIIILFYFFYMMAITFVFK
jgi:hypothetical protein